MGDSQPLLFQQQICFDEYLGRIPAFSLLIPKGWQASAGIQWTPENLMQMVWASMTAGPPENSSARFDLFPNRAFCAITGLPEGGNHLGMEVHAPLEPASYLVSYVLPRLRPGASGVNIVEQRALEEPHWPAPPGYQSAAGAVTCEFDLSGTSMRAEMEVSIAYATQMLPGPVGFQQTQVWYPLPAIVFSAPPGSFSRELRSMRDTLRVNPSWEQAVAATTERLMQEAQAQQQANFALQQRAYQMQQQTHAMQREVMRTMEEASNIQVSGWEARQQVDDRLSEQRSYAIRGVDPYVDPASSVPVELPTGYEGAWSNGRGEYVLSEDVSFDPNVGYPTDDNWYRLERADTPPA